MAVRVEELQANEGAAVYRFPVRQARARAAVARRRARLRRTGLGAASLLLAAGIVLGGGPGGVAPASSPGAPKTIVIRAGDTLWGVAEAHAPAGIDLRAYVDAIVELNSLAGPVQAGASLRLP